MISFLETLVEHLPIFKLDMVKNVVAAAQATTCLTFAHQYPLITVSGDSRLQRNCVYHLALPLQPVSCVYISGQWLPEITPLTWESVLRLPYKLDFNLWE